MPHDFTYVARLDFFGIKSRGGTFTAVPNRVALEQLFIKERKYGYFSSVASVINLLAINRDVLSVSL